MTLYDEAMQARALTLTFDRVKKVRVGSTGEGVVSLSLAGFGRNNTEVAHEYPMNHDLARRVIKLLQAFVGEEPKPAPLVAPPSFGPTRVQAVTPTWAQPQGPMPPGYPASPFAPRKPYRETQKKKSAAFRLRRRYLRRFHQHLKDYPNVNSVFSWIESKDDIRKEIIYKSLEADRHTKKYNNTWPDVPVGQNLPSWYVKG